jgi:hypothetical protein
MKTDIGKKVTYKGIEYTVVYIGNGYYLGENAKGKRLKIDMV